MKTVVLGLLAHVDSGKTTLSEAILYDTGVTRKMGRVDHGDTMLDTEKIEKSRGITVFSKQAFIDRGDTRIFLLDTPGHTDFGPEAERTLQVIDYAVLIVSASEGIQNHTKTLWDLLSNYNVPTFIFINKIDLLHDDIGTVMSEIRDKLSDRCIDFSERNSNFEEEVSLVDERILEGYLSDGAIDRELLIDAVADRRVIPVYSGSALKNVGVSEFVDSVKELCIDKKYPDRFGAKVYKVRYDANDRLTFLKVTRGELAVKDRIEYVDADGNTYTEKIDQIRLYTGDKFVTTAKAERGTVCAVTGLSHTVRGQGLGAENDSADSFLQSLFTYKVIYPSSYDTSFVLSCMRKLEEEEPQLKVTWNETNSSIYVSLTGKIQLEVISALALERFGIQIGFDSGSVVYTETIKAPVEGVGHYEPLRHYAEVHILIEPLPRGSGIEYDSLVSEDDLDRNWQRLIITHLREKEHVGVLTGSRITDVKLTLVKGKAHLKHTEGGDFRQATYRAVRNGLMQAESILLEPWYDFTITVPNNNVGRVMTDIQKMSGTVNDPLQGVSETILTGKVPVSEIRGYGDELLGFTHGEGRIDLSYCGYLECHNSDVVIRDIGYSAERDLDNTPDSVFCTHGAGYVVKWNEVPKKMHLEPFLKRPHSSGPNQGRFIPRPVELRSYKSLEDDEELLRIFESTYGKIKSDRRVAFSRDTALDKDKHVSNPDEKVYDSEYLIVDGYNVIFAWDWLKEIARKNLEDARMILADLLCNYKAFRQIEVILVFDAYRVKGNPGSIEKYNNITVVYTKEAETADMYIEKVTKEIGKKRKVRVATSDALEQTIILGHGAMRLPALALQDEIIEVEQSIKYIIE